MNPSARINLAELVTAKLAAFESKEQKRVQQKPEPKASALPPKVVEVYKK